MRRRGRRFLIGVAAIVGLSAIVYLTTFAWLLILSNPLEHPLAELPLWPVACSVRGCVGSDTWMVYQRAAAHFTGADSGDDLDPTESLTTAVRAHLVEEAFARAPVNLQDAKRYRETVLRLPVDSELLAEMGFTADEYDRVVLLPFLLQEALRQQYRAESIDELYRILEKQRGLWVLPRGLVWNSEIAAVERQ